jgi:hypothetical protein
VSRLFEAFNRRHLQGETDWPDPVIALATLISPSITMGTDLTNAANKELTTKTTHTGFAAGCNTVWPLSLAHMRVLRHARAKPS